MIKQLKKVVKNLSGS